MRKRNNAVNCRIWVLVILSVFLFIAFAVHPTHAQTTDEPVDIESLNLVPNSSFEEYEYCPQYYTPKDGSHRLIPHWIYPTLATPDYFHSCCNTGIVGVPKNFAGESNPKHGKGYMGLIAIGTDVNYREYIQAPLKSPLVNGEKYCVSFWYKLASYSRYAVDQLGLYFADHDLSGDEGRNNIEANLGFDPHVSNESGKMMNNTEEWQQLCGVFTATGNEEFIVIGNFRKYADTQMREVTEGMHNRRGKEYSYYYIDDVKVFPIGDNCNLCGCIPHDLKVDAKVEGRSISLFASGGTEPYTYKWNTGSTKSKLEKLPSGFYKYTVTDANGCRVSDSINFIAPNSTLKVTHKAHYTGGEDGWIHLYPTGGKKPYKYKWSNDSTTQRISNLGEGTYIYTVTDQNGDQVTNRLVFRDKFKQQLRKISEGDKITLENIFFDVDKTDLLPKSYVELDKLYEFMQDNKIREVEISGHTDSDGSDEHNQMLSEGRAKSVVDYLVSKGIERERLVAIGYGEEKPIATNATTAGKAKNRRVEFKITKK